MARPVIIKPIISEKSEKLSDGLSKYSFVVARKANKVQIRKEIEKMYSVNVKAVNTMVVLGKVKSRNTKAGVIKGSVPSFKKAIVTLESGEEIDYFGEI